MRHLFLITMTKTKHTQARRAMNRQNTVGTGLLAATNWNSASQRRPGLSRNLRAEHVVHKFTQIVDYGNVTTSSAGAFVGAGRSFVFGDLPQVSTFTGLFDQYRIDSIELWLDCSSSTGPLANAGVQWAAVIDYDNDTAPTTMNQLLQYQNCQEVPLGNGIYFHFKPRVAGNLAGSGLSSIADQWIDCNTNSARQYGVKYGMNATTTTFVVAVRARYHISLRNSI